VSVTVVIADDHQLVRQGLRRYLDGADGIEVIAEAPSGEAAVTVVERLQPDVALLDIRMGQLNGLEATKRIRERSPRTAVVILTGHEEEGFVLEAVRAGARGYVLKARDADHVIRTVRMVADGNLVLDPEVATTVTSELEPGRARAREDGGLTERELQILQLLAFGQTNREIGKELFISPDTVKTHLEHIYQKLGTSDRTAAVAEALRRGLID
jgi:DNA-binding NarL/FixJ family response regulator